MYSTQSRHPRKKARSLVAVMALSLASVGTVLATGGYVYGTQDTMTVTVTGKDRVVSKDDSKWLVMTDKMSFENTDSLLHWKFNSTDLQGKLLDGNVYDITYYGLRIPFFSVYPNIIEVNAAQ